MSPSRHRPESPAAENRRVVGEDVPSPAGPLITRQAGKAERRRRRSLPEGRESAVVGPRIANLVHHFSQKGRGYCDLLLAPS